MFSAFFSKPISWIESLFHKDEYQGPPTFADSLNTRTITNPLLFTKVDDYVILFSIFYGIYYFKYKK
jgi:hypothetical protein